MAFIRVPMIKGKEQKIAPEGQYALVVRSFKAGMSKAGNRQYIADIAFEEFPEYQNIRDFFSIPKDGAPNPDSAVRKLRRFLSSFGIEFDDDGFDDETVVGAAAALEVSVDSYEGSDGLPVPTNRIRYPRVSDD